MRRGYFRGFTASEKTELWDRWQRGESLKAIGRSRTDDGQCQTISCKEI
jgi:hypothetical protein